PEEMNPCCYGVGHLFFNIVRCNNFIFLTEQEYLCGFLKYIIGSYAKIKNYRGIPVILQKK
ncbi:MAG: hypothetical protein RR395_09380, partial [Ruthenibacterium sp.]